MIRPVRSDETDALVALGLRPGLFTAEEADSLLRETLLGIHSSSLGDGHFAFACEGPRGPEGWVYFADNPRTNGVWDLWWIGVDPELHGRGIGRGLLQFAEEHASSQGARVMLVETSASEALARTRKFYALRGYTVCGTVPDFYAPGEGKVIFARDLTERSSPPC